MDRKEAYLIISGFAALVVSYLGYVVVYLIGKQRLINTHPNISTESITLFRSIPSFSWFLLYSASAILIGGIVGFIIFKIKSK